MATDLQERPRSVYKSLDLSLLHLEPNGQGFTGAPTICLQVIGPLSFAKLCEDCPLSSGSCQTHRDKILEPSSLAKQHGHVNTRASEVHTPAMPDLGSSL